MTEPGEPPPAPAEDDRLLAELGRALGPDPLPAGLAARAEGLLALAGLDGELAELLEAAAEPTGVRGTPDAADRLLFEVAGGAVAVELVLGRDRIDGQVIAGAPTEVALERPHDTAAAATIDDLGRFGFDSVAAGPARLRLRGGPAGPVTTDWFLL
jgi:hypothetical protein